ncbi:MAG: ROK family protein [Alicyclobacillus sp.]|nr:ROK family protein [Alicyclobacillus sp.]
MEILAFDIGGTWLKVGLVNTTTGQVSNFMEIPSRSHMGPEPVVNDILSLYNTRFRSSITQIERIGIALGGGPVDWRSGRILGFTSGIDSWESYPLAERISEIFSCPVHIENDANAASLAEWQFGGYETSKVFVYITWSTGVSAGIVIDGQLFRGAHGIAGEIGHVPLATGGTRCICGGTDCLEDRVAGRKLAFQRPTSPLAAPQPQSSDQRQELCSLWVRALTTIVHLIGPDVIVMGGGTAWAYPDLLHTAWKMARSTFLPPLRDKSTFFISSLGRTNVLIGAALTAQQSIT